LITNKILYAKKNQHATGLRKIFWDKIFHHAPGLRNLKKKKNSRYVPGLTKFYEFHFLLCPRTWKNFLKVKFFHYAPGLDFFK